MATTIYDVLRYLVRNQGHANTGIERALLVTVDAAELGFPDRESYEEVLAQQEKEARAKARAESEGAPAVDTAEPTIAELEAQLERRKALETAKTTGAQTRQTLTGTPKPTS